MGLGDAASDASTRRRFRYAEQALLYCPPICRAERGRVRHSGRRARAGAVRDHRRRALLLFNQLRNLRVAEAHCAHAAVPLLVQGERPRTCCWRRCASASARCLLATQSFWEGVDVPGEALSLVVIDRIPFAVPTIR